MMNLSDIIVPKVFKESKPKESKLSRIRNYVLEHGTLDKPVVINSDNVIVDNYIRYLIAAEQGLKEVPVVFAQEHRNKHSSQTDISLPMTYVVGKFHRCDKEYIWKNDKDLTIEVGDKIRVVSKDKHREKMGTVVVTVTRIFKSDNPDYLKHRSVVKVVKTVSNN